MPTHESLEHYCEMSMATSLWFSMQRVGMLCRSGIAVFAWQWHTRVTHNS